MAKKVEVITWACKENCPKKCVLAVRDAEGKLDGRFALEDYPTNCPFAIEDIAVSWEARE